VVILLRRPAQSDLAGDTDAGLTSSERIRCIGEVALRSKVFCQE